MDGELDRLAGLVAERAASPAPLDRLAAAVAVADELRAQGDALLDRFVAEARGEARSWTEIGATLGTTKQAAHQRFVVTERAAGWPPNASHAVRSAMLAGEAEARRLGHNHLGTEHALLGLLAEPDGLAAHALAGLGVDREAVLGRIAAIVGTGPERRWDALCVAPRLKRALELARSHARALDHRCIGTEHLLLALADVEDGVAAEILRDLGVPPDRLRAQVAAMLGVEPDRLQVRARRRRLLAR